MRGGIRAVVGAALLCGGVVGGMAPAASASSAGGPTKVFVKPSETTSVKHPGKIILTGAVGDYGTVVSTTSAGKPTRKGTYRLLRLKKGTILVDITTFQKALGSSFTAPTALDRTTCSLGVFDHRAHHGGQRDRLLRRHHRVVHHDRHRGRHRAPHGERRLHTQDNNPAARHIHLHHGLGHSDRAVTAGGG